MNGINVGIKNVDHPGRFCLSRRFLTTQPSLAKKITCNMLIIRAELMFSDDKVYYVAFSPLFFPVLEGNTIPEYQIIFDEENNFYFQRI